MSKSKKRRLTPEVVEALERYFVLTGFVSSAARLVGVGRATFYRWMARGRASAEGSIYRELYDRISRADAELEVGALRALWKHMNDEELSPARRARLAWWFIERRYPELLEDGEIGDRLDEVSEQWSRIGLDSRGRRRGGVVGARPARNLARAEESAGEADGRSIAVNANDVHEGLEGVETVTSTGVGFVGGIDGSSLAVPDEQLGDGESVACDEREAEVGVDGPGGSTGETIGTHEEAPMRPERYEDVCKRLYSRRRIVGRDFPHPSM